MNRSQKNVVSNECGLKLSGLKWIGPKWLLPQMSWSQINMVSNECSEMNCRGVTRLDGARGIKQVWRPHVRTWGLSEANLLYWRNYLQPFCNFSAPQNDSASPQWFGARGIVPPLLLLITPLMNGNGNGLLFHMTQPISRSTIKAIACSKPTISEH